MQEKSEPQNYILTTPYTTQWKIKSIAAKRLEMYEPKGCPFKNYTCLDLLKDWIGAYSWILDRGQRCSISDFISKIRNKDEKAHVYGEAIIKLLEM